MSTKSSGISIRRTPRARRARYFLLCTGNEGYEASLEQRKIYVGIPDSYAASHDQVGVIDESGEDYLVPAEYFTEVSVGRRIARLLKHAV
jgi:hypothetical protein